jgi:outer membrane protein TolC
MLKRRIVSLALSAVLALGCVLPAMAAETTDELQVLTIDEATQKAISYSHKLKSISESIDEAYDEQSDIVDQFNRATEGYNAMDLSTSVRRIRNTIANYELSEETEKISIGFSVKEFFANVILAEKDLELYNQNLEISGKELKVAELKLKLGKISQTEYDNQLNSYKKIESQIISKDNAIKNAYISLNTVLGVSDLETRYQLEYEPEFAEYSGDSLETTITKALSVSQTLLEKQRSYELSAYKLKNFTKLDVDSGETRTQVQNDVSEQARNLADAKVSLEKEVRSDYDSIVQYQVDYKNACIQLSQLENELEIARVKYSLGKITEIELNKAEYEVENQKASVDKIVYDYTLLVERFDNPVLY